MPPSTSEEINEDPLKEILDSTTQNEILNIITITVVDKIKQLGRDGIIKLAIQELAKNNINIDPNNYKIRVMANKTTIFVSFHIPIKYLPLNSQFYGDIGVNIIEKQLSHSVLSNPRDLESYDRKNISFYKQTEDAKKHLQFVLNSDNKNNNSIDIEKLEFEFFEDDMVVREQLDHYEVNFVSKNWDESYMVDKVSGKKYNIVTGTIAHPPRIEKGKYYEIK